MTEENKEQIYAEIDGEGFGYWVQNYATSSLKSQNSPENLIELAENAKKALDALEQGLRAENIIDW